MAKTNNSSVPAFGMKDRLGYMFGDFGNDFTFILSSMFMMKFYTDVVEFSRSGRYGHDDRPFCRRVYRRDYGTDCRPLQTNQRREIPSVDQAHVQSGNCQFPDIGFSIPDMSGFDLVWLIVTYLLWGSIFYTSINIPYGSMASAISSDPTDRTSLSTWRTSF